MNKNSKKLDAEVLINQFFGGMSNNLLMVVFAKVFSKDEAEKTLDELFISEYEKFINHIEPMLTNDQKGFSNLKQIINKTYGNFKNNILKNCHTKIIT